MTLQCIAYTHWRFKGGGNLKRESIFYWTHKKCIATTHPNHPTKNVWVYVPHTLVHRHERYSVIYITTQLWETRSTMVPSCIILSQSVTQSQSQCMTVIVTVSQSQSVTVTLTVRDRMMVIVTHNPSHLKGCMTHYA